MTDAEAEKLGGRQVARRGRRPKSAVGLSLRRSRRAGPDLPDSRSLLELPASRAREPSRCRDYDGAMGLALVAGPAKAGKIALLLERYLDALDRDPVLIVPNRSDVERVERDLLRRTSALLARLDRDLRRPLSRACATGGRDAVRSPATPSARYSCGAHRSNER